MTQPIYHTHQAVDCPDPHPERFRHWPPGVVGMNAPGVVDLTAMDPADADTWIKANLAKVSDQSPETQAALGMLPELNQLLRLGWDPDRSQVLAVAVTQPMDHRNVMLGHHLVGCVWFDPDQGRWGFLPSPGLDPDHPDVRHWAGRFDGQTADLAEGLRGLVYLSERANWYSWDASNVRAFDGLDEVAAWLATIGPPA